MDGGHEHERVEDDDDLARPPGVDDKIAGDTLP